MPGLDGTGVLFRPLLKFLPPHIQPVVISYPNDKELGYNDLPPIVLKSLPLDSPFVLLGESFGGPLSLLIAATHSPQLRALILCASFVSCPQNLVPSWSAPLVRTLPFHLFPHLARLKALLGGYASNELLSLSSEALSQVQPRVLAHRTREVMKVNLASELAVCDLPILYIQGKQDFVVPPANLQRILHINSAVQSVQLPAPHMVLQIQPELAAAAIENFITNNQVPDPSRTPNKYN